VRGVRLNQYKSNRTIVYSSKYHIVWCPKYRRSILVENIAKRLETILRETCRELQVDVLALEIMPDHVHLRAEVDPHFGVHRVVKRLKGKSSRLLRQEFPTLRSRLPTLWTNSYFVATVGGAPLSVIQHYVESQKDV
jgi:REP-associated tyrosine transposase